jgi:hypothetical protein
MPAKKKTKKMEAKLVSKEKHEIKYTAKKAKTSQKKVRAAQAKTRSRKKIMAELTGITPPPKKKPVKKKSSTQPSTRKYYQRS